MRPGSGWRNAVFTATSSDIQRDVMVYASSSSAANRPGGGHPPEAEGVKRAANFGVRGREGLQVGAHPVRRGVRAARDELFPDWKAKGAPLKTAVARDDVCSSSKKRRSHAQPLCRIPCTTGTTTSSRSAAWCAGSASRPRRWGSRSIRASPRRRHHRRREHRARRGINDGRGARRQQGRLPPAWSCAASTRSSPRAASANSASGCSKTALAGATRTRSTTPSG